MLRRTFLASGLAALSSPINHPLVSRDVSGRGTKLAQAARDQLGVTTGYDPSYTRISYPNGDVPRTTGVCADVIIRAVRDALSLDLQRLVHDDMIRDFAVYPHAWGLHAPDANIDHRRVLNLEVFWRRAGAQLWTAPGKIGGDAFTGPLAEGDILTWILQGNLPHVGIVVAAGPTGPRIIQNIGAGVQENYLWQMREQHAKGHFRWLSI